MTPEHKHVVITSFTEDGFKKYGQRCLETFKEFWPESVKLEVYFEGTNLRHGWKTINEVPKLKEWMRVIAPFQLFSGALFDQYAIQYDARTNRVIFMQNHALRKYRGKVFWMDGDCITHAPVTTEFLDELLPDDKMCCYLGRDGWYDSETGFIGFNYQHPNCEEYLKIQEHVLFSGIIFAQERWWDMTTIDWARKCMLAKDPALQSAFVDLAADLPRGTMHVFVNSRVGEVMDHLKGARKGKTSLAADLVVERTEPYWQKILGSAETETASPA